jgi:hypothetical protein
MKIREQDFPKMTFTTSEWFVQVCGSFIRADQRPCRLHDPNEQSICGGVGQVRGGVHRRYPNFLIDRRGARGVPKDRARKAEAAKALR